MWRNYISKWRMGLHEIAKENAAAALMKHAYCTPLLLEIFKSAALSAWPPKNNLKENAKSWRRHPSKTTTAL